VSRGGGVRRVLTSVRLIWVWMDELGKGMNELQRRRYEGIGGGGE